MHLCCADKKLNKLIAVIGDYKLTLQTDYYSSLVRIIIGQQLSLKAARSIWGKLLDYSSITPEAILNLNNAALSNIGISKAKISYLHDLSSKVVSQNIDFVNIEKLKDHDIKEILMSVKGIGDWSSDMFLIFSLGRINILSPNDVGLKRSAQWLYELSTVPSIKDMENIGLHWAPYRTIGSLYLWEAVNRGLHKTSL